MENEMEEKIRKIIEKFTNREVIITQISVVESKFCLKNLKIEMNDGIISIEENRNMYLTVDIDDIENIYFKENVEKELTLILYIDDNTEVEIKTIDNNVNSKNKCLEKVKNE